MLSSSSIYWLSASLGDRGLFSTAIIIQIANVIRQFVFLSMFLANYSSPIFSMWNEWNVLPFLNTNLLRPQGLLASLGTKVAQATPPRPQVFSTYNSINSSNFVARLTLFFTCCKILRNLVDNGWLWQIVHGIVANYKLRNILNE